MHFLFFFEKSPERVYWLRNLNVCLRPFLNSILHCTNRHLDRRKKHFDFFRSKIWGPNSKNRFLISLLLGREIADREVVQNGPFSGPEMAFFGVKMRILIFHLNLVGKCPKRGEVEKFWPSGSRSGWKSPKFARNIFAILAGRNWDSAIKFCMHLS